MIGPDRHATLQAVESGIHAVVEAGRGGRPDAPTPCVQWDAVTLVRHLEGIAGAYLLWTGSSVGGRIGRMRSGEDAARYNATILERLPRLDLDDHLTRYTTLALDHVRLARATWDTPMLETPEDVVLDVGRHAGVAAIEWHVHAWDLARSQDRTHVPDDDSLGVLVWTWDATLGDAVGVPRDPTIPPWDGVLAATGRTP